MWSRKLIWQLYGAFLLIIIIPALFFTWYTTTTFRSFFINRTITSLTEKAYQLCSQMEGYTIESRSTVSDSLCKYLAQNVPTRFTVINCEGTVTGDSEKDPDSMENHANRSEIIAAFSGKVGVSDRYSYTLGQQMLYVAVPMRHNGEVSGTVRASLSITNIQHELDKMYYRVGFGFFIVALIAAFVSYALSRRISRPINAMKFGAERFASGDFSGKLMPAGCEEIDQLSDVLNNMALRLRDTIDSLKEQHHRIEAVLSSMVEGVIALDNEQRIITVNDAAVKLFDLSERPESGRWIGEVLRNAKISQFIKKVVDSGKPVESEVTIAIAGRKGIVPEHFLQLHGNSLKNAAGEVMGALVVINDITRLKKLETVRSDFVANVSHELRTPLTSVKGFVETLLAGAIDDPDEARRFLQIIARQVERLSTIVQDLLALSRIEQENTVHQLELKNVKVRELVDGAMESCNAKAGAKNISVTIDVQESLTAELEPALIEEALINLIDNAINYSAEGSIVRVCVKSTAADGMITFSVSDNGPGIAPEHHERIFERFYRVDKARSRKLGGTGLGLSIVKHIALVHGGEVSLESVPGEGSTFFIRIPPGKRSSSRQE